MSGARGKKITIDTICDHIDDIGSKLADESNAARYETDAWDIKDQFTQVFARKDDSPAMKTLHLALLDFADTCGREDKAGSVLWDEATALAKRIDDELDATASEAEDDKRRKRKRTQQDNDGQRRRRERARTAANLATMHQRSQQLTLLLENEYLSAVGTATGAAAGSIAPSQEPLSGSAALPSMLYGTPNAEVGPTLPILKGHPHSSENPQ